jgi:MinD-like ATPase involved in chromosome partitioning or flagellar assembly
MAASSGAAGEPARIHVTIRSSGRDVEARVDPDVPVGQLMPELLRLAIPPDGPGPGDRDAWAAGLEHGEPFMPWSSLADSGVRDGAVILVERHERWPAPIQAADVLLPRQRSVAALPADLGVAGRARAALLAAAGRTSPRVAHSPLAVPDRGSAVQRLRRSWRSTAYERRLEDVIQSTILRRSVTIAVVSPKGGVGKTTVTALLGGLYALLRRDRIVAVDTNPDYGSLGRSLTPAHGVFVDDLLEVLDSPELTVTELDTHLGRGPHGLMVVPSPTDPQRMALLDRDAYTRVIRRLQEMVGMVMLDCGTGLHDPALRAALDTADQVVLVTDANPATASLVSEAGAYLRATGLPIWLVVNRVPTSGSRLRIGALEAQLPFAKGLAVVPAEDRAAGHVADGSFDWREAPGGWRRSIRELAAVLAVGWADVGAT